jgi:hypothetical protein
VKRSPTARQAGKGDFSGLFAFGIKMAKRLAHDASPTIDFGSLNSNNIWRDSGGKKLYSIGKDPFCKERNGNSYFGL